MLSHGKSEHDVILKFRTRYSTYPGQMLFVIGDHPLLGCWSRQNALAMRYLPSRTADDFNWEVEIRFSTNDNVPVRLEYKYIVLTSARTKSSFDVRREKDAEICWDAGPNRSIEILNTKNQPLFVSTGDLFQAPISVMHHLFFKMSFTDMIYSHECKPSLITDNAEGLLEVHFRVIAIQIAPSCRLMITGSHPLFANWTKYEPMTPIDSIYWEYKMLVPRDQCQFDYKYVIQDDDGEIEWEERDNRTYTPVIGRDSAVIYHDWIFQREPVTFKGAGLLVGLFSVHSKNSIGKIGEFEDIKLLVDFAVRANLLLIQLLPIQDVNCYYGKGEGTPSMQVSAFAFNPMYLTLRKIDGYEEVEAPFERDFGSVTKFKYAQLEKIFSRLDKQELLQSSEFIEFVRLEEYWLFSYCAWCAIRDGELEKNPGKIPVWPDYETVNIPSLLEMPANAYEEKALFHAWIQFMCHRQLSEVSEYAKQHRVVLSCSMTIGQNMHSSDTWSHPELFDKDYTIGSPPDIFSFHGQNWYYPSWNWEAMRAEDYAWLRNRIAHKERYFQAGMFDHPLGLFRCWSIPAKTDNPLFGHFVPSAPINLSDLHGLQIRDIAKLCRPLFPISDVLSLSMPENAKEKLINALAVCENGVWRFRARFESDRDVKRVIKEFKQQYTSLDERLQFDLARKILLSYFESVCLIPDSKEPHRKFYPRYSMTDSMVFNSLPERDAQIMYKLFVDFYYRTNIGLWHEQGHQKLSVLANSRMQLFGYDLGVILHDEEKGLHRVGMCSCHVQRIPRESSLRFDLTTNFPYLSVCTPSPHDLPHLALWWKRSQADAQQFYYQILKMDGVVPQSMTPEIAKAILKQHLDSRSMWCLFVFEDLMSLSDKFKDVVDTEAFLNDPAEKNNWDYRIGVSLEKLLNKNGDWVDELSTMIEETNRGRKAYFK